MKSALSDIVSRLKLEWEDLQPLSLANEERLWKKFRLEWNYHSNHIEGNTLTYGETELLLIFGDTKGNHTLREYEEMKAHDVAIAHIRAMAKESNKLSETDIRNLNKLILKEPFWKEAITAGGELTQKEVIPGQYKMQPNNVRTATGEIFSFTDPLDVPIRMQEYIGRLNSDSETSFFHYLSRIHHEFLLIHPFDDGNGRVARLLLNYVLLKNGYPPIIIRSEQKREYLSALHRADTGERDYSEVIKLLENNLIWSLEVAIRAARGESIEEALDIEKEIALFAKEQARKPDPPKTIELISDLWQKSFAPFLIKFSEKMDRFKPLFSKVEIISSYGPLQTIENPLKTINSNNLTFFVNCERYSGKSKYPFDYNFNIQINFNKYDYSLIIMQQEFFTLPYSRFLSSSDVDNILEKVLKLIFADIKKRAVQ